MVKQYRKIIIRKNFYAENEPIFKTTKVELIANKLNILVGPNGSGKTTLLKAIQEHCDKNKLTHYEYFDIIDGRTYAQHKFLSDSNLRLLSNSYFNSEGQNISQNLSIFLCNIVKEMDNIVNSNRVIYLLIDGADSGTDINNINELKKILNDIISKFTHKNKLFKIYCVISCNSYELTIGEHCINAFTLLPIEFKSYNGYRKFIIDSNKEIGEYRYGKQSYNKNQSNKK